MYEDAGREGGPLGLGEWTWWGPLESGERRRGGCWDPARGRKDRGAEEREGERRRGGRWAEEREGGSPMGTVGIVGLEREGDLLERRRGRFIISKQSIIKKRIEYW